MSQEATRPAKTFSHGRLSSRRGDHESSDLHISSHRQTVLEAKIIRLETNLPLSLLSWGVNVAHLGGFFFTGNVSNCSVDFPYSRRPRNCARRSQQIRRHLVHPLGPPKILPSLLMLQDAQVGRSVAESGFRSWGDSTFEPRRWDESQATGGSSSLLIQHHGTSRWRVPWGLKPV